MTRTSYVNMMAFYMKAVINVNMIGIIASHLVTAAMVIVVEAVADTCRFCRHFRFAGVDFGQRSMSGRGITVDSTVTLVEIANWGLFLLYFQRSRPGSCHLVN